MNIRKCSKCGWEYPASWPQRSCKFCGTELKTGYCSRCKKWSNNIINSQCSQCRGKRVLRYRHARYKKAVDRLESWLELIRQVPQPYHTLTEGEWQEACRYFNGCAYCGSEEISTRYQFIPFTLGGRYCNWNIIPLCETCATLPSKAKNPFELFDSYLISISVLAHVKQNYKADTLTNVLNYLEPKLKEVLK